MYKISFLYDSQTLAPDAYCDCCEAELWGREADPDRFGHVLCPECRTMAAKIRNRVRTQGAA